jgi:hypothetical protein
MADLNALIAQGAQFKEPPNPFAQYAQMQQLQQGAQQNQMNQMKMQEYQRGVQEQNALQNVVSRPGFDPMNTAHQQDAYSAAPSLAPKYLESVLTTRESQGKISAADIKAKTDREGMLAQAGRDLANRPDNENIVSHNRDVQSSSLFTPNEKAKVQARTDMLLALPMDQRAAVIGNPGASAGEVSTAATALAGQQSVANTATLGRATTERGQDIVANTATLGRATTERGQNIVANTAAAGQNITLRGQNLLDTREKENIAIRQETQRREGDPVFKQQMAQAAATGQAIAKDQALAQQVLPKVLDTAQQTLGQIDSLIGKRDGEGKLLKGQAPHPGFQDVVGSTYLPGLRFVPGTNAADFQSKFDQIKGGAFLQAFETLKGGGSITNVEGEKGTAALNRMSLSQSEKEFVSAAREFQGIIRKGVERARMRVGGGVTSIDPATEALLKKYE